MRTFDTEFFFESLILSCAFTYLLEARACANSIRSLAALLPLLHGDDTNSAAPVSYRSPHTNILASEVNFSQIIADTENSHVRDIHLELIIRILDFKHASKIMMQDNRIYIHIYIYTIILHIFVYIYIYRVSQEEWTKLRESVPYVELCP